MRGDFEALESLCSICSILFLFPFYLCKTCQSLAFFTKNLVPFCAGACKNNICIHEKVNLSTDTPF